MALLLLSNCSRTRRTFTGASGDTTAPTAPVITATAQSDTVINIALTTASTDASGIASYQLEWSANGSSGWTVLSSAASFPYSHTGLTQTTLYYYRARAVDASPNANVSAYSSNTSASTFSTPTFMWPTQSPGYVSALPRVGGYGMDSYGGSGRDGAEGRVTVFLLDDLTNATVSATYLSYTRILHGSLNGFKAVTGPKVLVPIVSGTINMQSDYRPGSTMDYYGQFAPANGLLWRATQPSSVISYGTSNASNQRWWHLDCRIGDDAAGITPSDRDAAIVGGYSDTGANAGQKNIHINCCYGWSLDEIVDGYYAGDLTTFQSCAFIEPLHKSIHDDGGINTHGYGPILGEGYHWVKMSIQRCLFAHAALRQPETATISFAYANNLIYNPADTSSGVASCVQLSVDYDAATPYTLPMYTNIAHNMIVKGPDGVSTVDAIKMQPDIQPAGSQGYLKGNVIDGWTYGTQASLMTGTYPASWLQTSLVSNAWPGSWGTGLEGIYAITTTDNPNGASTAEKLAFATKIQQSVGPRPNKTGTYNRSQTVAQHVLAQLNNSGDKGQCVNSVDGTSNPSGWPNTSLRFSPNAGGWPSISTVSVDPFNPGGEWNSVALPLNGNAPDDRVLASGTFSTGVSKVGWTVLEAWALEQHYFRGGQ